MRERGEEMEGGLVGVNGIGHRVPDGLRKVFIGR